MFLNVAKEQKEILNQKYNIISNIVVLDDCKRYKKGNHKKDLT